MIKKIGFSLLLLFFLSTSGEIFVSGKVYSQTESSLYSSYLKGILAEKYGNTSRALKEYKQAVKVDQDSAILALRKAAQYLRLEEYQQAEAVLYRIKDKDPLNLDIDLFLVFLYSRQGKVSQANKVYGGMLEKMYEQNPEDLSVTQDLARYKMDIDDYDKAVSLYQEIIKAKPQDAEAYFWLGYAYEEKGQRNKAIKKWEKALDLDPNHADSLNALGYIYAEQGIKLDRAEILVKRALEIRPGLAAYLDSLGWVYFKKGDFQKAKKYIEQAAEKMEDPVILEHLGQIYYKLGEFRQAENVWQRVLELKPDSEKIRKRLEKINYEISTKQD
jgi:tetratricopeptide (TPR) repeat protein